jgi:hypothetical protein
MRTPHLAKLQRQLDQLPPEQVARVGSYVQGLSPERREFLERAADYLATRFDLDPQPLLGAVHATSSGDESDRRDGFDMQVDGRPDLSGIVTFLEWIYIGRNAAAKAISQASVRVGPGFNIVDEIRAMRDATTSDGGPADASHEDGAPPADLVDRTAGTASQPRRGG